MLKHYLTVAFRNLRKYKMQSVISIVGLAVGFTCFALASLWIRYEMTYDDFHKNADRLYTISTPHSFNPHGYARQNPYPLAAYLKETFPEVTNACSINAYGSSGTYMFIEIDSVKYPLRSFASVDSSFLSFFDISIIEGNLDFTFPESGKIAISEAKAKAIFHDESPLDKKTNFGTICAVVRGYSKHSNYPFEILTPLNPNPEWISSSVETLIELAPGVDVAAFKNKLYEHKIQMGGSHAGLSKIMMTPLTAMRYEDPNIEREVEYQHIVLFAFAGTLVILCSLFNSLTLFVCRFKIREKEFALRMVAGASGRSLLLLWAVEFLMSLIPAFLLSLILIQLTISPFQKLSAIQMEISAVYLESAVYVGSIIAISLLVFIGVLFLFRRKSLNASIRKSNKNLFRKVSIILQLVISIGFIFCTSVMIKQLYFLHHTNDLGFTYKNTATLTIYRESYSETLENQIRQIPEITETLRGYVSLLPVMGQTGYGFTYWDDKPSDVESINLEHVEITKQYAEFYGFQLIEGEMLGEDESENNVLINESAAKAFGWEHPIGKKFSTFRVKGVIRNVYSSLPTVEVKPFMYRQVKQEQKEWVSRVSFRYREGSWKACKNKIETLTKKEYADYHAEITSMEEEYDKNFKSENALLKLLSLLSLVCVIISVFGVFSMISLSCEERRKEIAIRKINGATMENILSMYFKMYFSLLIIGAVIAFPIGYYIMKQWLEQYIKQTGIGAWIYLSIIFVMAFVIILCVGWRVYKASVENPAEVIKN
jgi:hypothetical protein